MLDFSFFTILWASIAFIICLCLFFITAPYGRHIREGWGPLIPARLGWILMESPCVILVIGYAALVRQDLLIVHQIFLLIWLIHYTHRTLIYPLVIRMTNTKMPLSIALSALLFNIINVTVQCSGIFYFTQYSVDWMQSSQFVLGLSLFCVGMFINIKSDYIVAALKKERGPGYHIPDKFLHKYIASPNYFGEIIEWAGWAMLTWSVSGVLFLIWTIGNLLPRALANHRWYRENFDNYPKERKAIIPGIL